MKITRFDYVFRPAHKVWQVQYELDGYYCKTLVIGPADLDIVKYVCEAIRYELDCEPRELLSKKQMLERSSTKPE